MHLLNVKPVGASHNQ